MKNMQGEERNQRKGEKGTKRGKRRGRRKTRWEKGDWGEKKRRRENHKKLIKNSRMKRVPARNRCPQGYIRSDDFRKN